MSNTPRTDAIPRRGAFHHYVIDDILDLARQLERELTEASLRLESYRGTVKTSDTLRARIAELEAERDAAKESKQHIDALRVALKSCLSKLETWDGASSFTKEDEESCDNARAVLRQLPPP